MYSQDILGLLGGGFKAKPYTDCVIQWAFGKRGVWFVQSMPTMTYQIGLSHLNFNLIRASDSPTAAVGAIITLTCVCVYV